LKIKYTPQNYGQIMSDSVRQIVQHFRVQGEFVDARPYGNGHINDTYLAEFDQGETTSRYLLRRINQYVFKKPGEVMENIALVTDHIRRKLRLTGCNEISRSVMTIIPTASDRLLLETESGEYWTMFLFIENTRTYQTLKSPEQAYQAANMFGRFQSMLADVPLRELHETIPHFHDGPKRFGDFRQALEDDSFDRADSAASQIRYLQQQAHIFDILPRLLKKGEIPLRVTHNDTKLNNLLFDADTDRAICVVDLDTTMPGLAAYDFGDLLRTTLSPTCEDETDISKICVRLPVFQALAKGYLDAASEFLTTAEKQHLITGGKMMTLIMATRFLTDYLHRDRYYKTDHPLHNLHRCAAQLRLLECINQQEREMTEILNEAAKD